MSFIFNGSTREYLRILVGLERPAWAPIFEQIIEIPGRPGGIVVDNRIAVRRINVPVRVYKKGFHSLEDVEEDLTRWLVTDEPKPLVFPHKPDRTYFAKVSGELILEEYPEWGEGVITFICPDPYKYGPETDVTFSSDIFTLDNEGSVETEPIFNLTVRKPVHFALIQNQENEYNMIGKFSSVDEKVINPKTLLFEETGENIATWAPESNVDGGVASGSFGTDGSGITVASYGTPREQWHGPSVKREVPPTQDFEVEAYLQGSTPTRMHTFRVEVYLRDEYDKVLGKISVVDNTSYHNTIIAEARVGALSDGNYVINGSNYNHNWNYFYGLIRVRRVGKRFEFYVTRRDTNGKHVNSYLGSYTDNGGKYSGRLKYIQIHIGKYGNITPSAKFFSVKAYSLNQPKEDETPYIADTGDIITFDHTTSEVFINGEERSDLKQFGASYFKLKPGDNQLIVAPSDSFDVNCWFRTKER